MVFNHFMDGVRLDPDIIKLTKNMVAHVKDNKDIVCAITGFRGTGKSLLSFLLTFLINKNFDFDRHVVLLPTEENIKNRLNALNPYEALVIDEAVRSLYKMDYATSSVKVLYKKFTTDRKFNRIVFLNIPDINSLTFGFRNEILNFWIHMYDVGKAVLLRRNEKVISSDPFEIETLKKYYRNSKLYTKEDTVKILSKLPNYVGELHFDEKSYKKLYVDSGIEDVYNELSKRANLAADEEEAKQVTESVKMIELKTKFIRYTLEMTKRFGITAKESAEILGLNEQTMYNWKSRYLGVSLQPENDNKNTNHLSHKDTPNISVCSDDKIDTTYQKGQTSLLN